MTVDIILIKKENKTPHFDWHTGVSHDGQGLLITLTTKYHKLTSVQYNVHILDLHQGLVVNQYRGISRIF